MSSDRGSLGEETRDPISRFSVLRHEGADPIDMLRAVWRYRRVFAAVVLLGVVLSTLVVILNTRYVATSLFLVPDFTLESWKKYRQAIADQNHLEGYIRNRGLDGTQTAGILRQLLKTPGKMEAALQPAFDWTKKDTRQVDIEAPDQGRLIGLQLTVDRRQLSSESPLREFGEYIRHTAISVDTSAEVVRRCNESNGRFLEIDQQRLQSSFDTDLLKRKAANLREIASSSGQQTMAADVRQLVSVANGGERYLPVSTQLVAVEVDMLDQREKLERLEWQSTVAKFNQDFYCAAEALQDSEVGGPELLEQLEELHASLESQAPSDSAAYQQASLATKLELVQLRARYMQAFRFVNPPEGAERVVRSPGFALALLLGTLLTTIIGMLLALVLAWWHDHRREILGADTIGQT